MKKNRTLIILKEKLFQTLRSTFFFPVFLLVVTFITYGIFIPVLGYIGDDFSLVWLAYKVGSIDSFFGQNRPIWGQIFLLISKFLLTSPWIWHLAFTLLRWLTAILIFQIFRCIKQLDNRAAYWISLLFLIYPGAVIYYMPLTFSVHFLALFFLITSFWLSLKNPHNKKWQFISTFVSLFLAFLNLISTEFFYFLELLRPVFIWLTLSEKSSIEKLKKTAFKSAPFLLLFIAVSVYRYFNQTRIVNLDSPVLIYEFLANPINAAIKIIPIMINDIFHFGILGWLNAFKPFQYLAQQGKMTSLIYIAVVMLSSIGIYLYLIKANQRNDKEKNITKRSHIWLFAFGLLALLLAGFAPWIAGLETSIERSINNRFSQAFVLGASIIFTGFLLLFRRKSKIPILLLSITCALSIGIQLLNANEFRYNWIGQKRFFWQFAWRFPSLPAPTLIIADYPTVKLQAENPLSAGINWIYFHDSWGRTKNQIEYYLYYDEVNVMAQLNGLSEPLPSMRGHMIGTCLYEKYHLLTISNKTSCMQVLDPVVTSVDLSLRDYMKRGAAISDLNLSFSEDLFHEAVMDINIFGIEPSHDWCYYYEKADLARSYNDWQEMLRLIDEAEKNGFRPAHPSEKMIFIYAYLGSGQAEKALALSREISIADSEDNPMICKIWEKFVSNGSTSLTNSYSLIKDEFTCQVS